MMVAQRLPASRETVEKSAAAKASARPGSESRNLIHTSAEADCTHCASRFGSEGLAVEAFDFNGLAYVEPTSVEPSIPRWNGQSRSACRKSVRNVSSARLGFVAVKQVKNEEENHGEGDQDHRAQEGKPRNAVR